MNQSLRAPGRLLRQYMVVTAAYWAFTLSDGALRMLVIFHFHELGYSTLDIALLFVFYEFFGVLTNLAGGWIGARYGLRLTLRSGLLLQVVALLMLAPVAESWPKLLSVVYVMAAQALSGIAKDLSKMSAKSAIKTVVPVAAGQEQQGERTLFHWVAILTGSKNALKGVGFFLGGAALFRLGFAGSVSAMAVGLVLAWLLTLSLPDAMGKMKQKPAFAAMFSKSRGINVLSLARFFLFGARDVWFVVALPVFLEMSMNWNFWQVGGFMGLWVVGYGLVQAMAPGLRRLWGQRQAPGPGAVQFWSAVLMVVPALMAVALWRSTVPGATVQGSTAVILGLTVFGLVFAMNSSIHSYMVLAYTEAEDVSLNVGFYYMANAGGRLLGTVLSGLVFQLAGGGAGGMAACLWGSALLVALSCGASLRLPRPRHSPA
ncbi:organoarsenical effux MFS transporter ArsJ [Candidatus Synechococcus spongiarum]|uniref:MFS transporter n=2 Tax=Candidatus Synechococcus spongiarum TaxID=431041 RepID=A0A1T1D6C6_9SYNE|nr:organoarsenical effux MFS transporter ArsJ [Candidatus Synechococcus spongiarum]OOV36419.1 MFS transporter [Candidatus Synechococcus spongiarum LMB bulk15N]